MRLSDPVHLDRSAGADPGSKPVVYRADVLAVDVDGATLTVPGYSDLRDYAGVPFMPRGASDIAPGDDCWVAFDDERRPVIVCWRPV